MPRFGFVVTMLALLALPRVAFAQRELLTPLGGKGQLAIDQISGLRVGVNPYGPSVDYYGPIGLAVQSYNEATGAFPGATATVHETTFWLAPSADFFVIDHLSVGGLIAFATTSTSIDQPVAPGRNQTFDQPTLNSFEILPRVGWLFALTDRWGIWPRGGIGYATQGVSPFFLSGGGPNPASSDSVHGLILDLDVGFLFRVNETFFLRAAPEFGWLPAGAHSTTTSSGISVSNDASYWQFTMTAGIGVLLDL